MKITQEVRDFAAKQNQEADAFIAAHPPRHGEGNHLAKPNGGARAPLDAASAEQGMAEMSKVFRETGSELYMGAGDRERD